ncbi:MAG TPA: RNA 2',3'-cyclic phosphodiesterase [Pyrinomonadaceae bacterium]|jgi:2'-5' RNA ligase
MSQPAERKTLRLFFALAPTDEARERAAAHAAALRESCPRGLKVSWERAEKFHVTMKFFGDVAADRVGQLSRAAGRAASRHAPFSLRLEGCGVFPSRSRPHVLWLGLTGGGDRLAALSEDVEAECAREGFARETRPFHPHITLARLRSTDADARRLAGLHLERGFGPVGFPLAEFVLMHSELGAHGSAYNRIARYELGVEVRG